MNEINVTFDKNETTIIYRIFQEILTNITRHSNADNVTVLLTKREDDFVLMVTDNGVGFEMDQSNKTNSLGLMGMQERALSIGGDLQVESSPGQGTTITFILPKVDVNYAIDEIYL
jgi:signal transduction histidine kinase